MKGQTRRPIRLEDLLSEEDIRDCYAAWEIANRLQPTIHELYQDWMKRHPKFVRARQRSLERSLERAKRGSGFIAAMCK